MEFYYEILINTTKNIKINQQLVIFNQRIVGKQLFQITIMRDYSQRSIPYPKQGNVTSTPQPFTFGPQFLVVQKQTFIYTTGNYTNSSFKFLSLFWFGKIL